MAFRLPFFKSKAPAKPPAEPPPPPPATPPPPPSVVHSPPQSQGLQSLSKKIPVRQGNLAAALQAASNLHPPGTQSAVYKPKVSVVVKAGGEIPTISHEPEAVPEPPAPPPPVTGSVEIPTSEILPLLPENVLRPGHTAVFPPTISLQLADVLPQLARGRVQFPASMLLATFPQDSIEPSVLESGDLQIKIPLHQIVPRIPDDVMQLPSGQVKQQIDPNIEVPFTERGGGKTPVPAAAPAPIPAPATSSAPMVPPAPSPSASKPPATVPPPAVPATPPPTPPPADKPPQMLKDKLATASALTPLTSLAPSEATRALTTSIKLPLRPSASAPKLQTISGEAKPLPPPPVPLSTSKSSPTIKKQDSGVSAPITFQPPFGLKVPQPPPVPPAPIPQPPVQSAPPPPPPPVPPPVAVPVAPPTTPTAASAPSKSPAPVVPPPVPPPPMAASVPPPPPGSPSLGVPSPVAPPAPPSVSSATVQIQLPPPLAATRPPLPPVKKPDPEAKPADVSSTVKLQPMPMMGRAPGTAKMPPPPMARPETAPAVPSAPVVVPPAPKPVPIPPATVPAPGTPPPPVLKAPTPVFPPAPVVPPAPAVATPPAPVPAPLPLPIVKAPAAPPIVADKPVPLPPPEEGKVVTPSKPVEAAPGDLRVMLDLPKDESVKLQDVAEKIRTKYALSGVLVATSDGLPLLSAMPAGTDLNGWSSIGAHVFQKLDEVGRKLSFGAPQRCLLSLGDSWVTLWHDHGVYMVVCHEMDKVSPDFESTLAELGKAIAAHCQIQHSPT